MPDTGPHRILVIRRRYIGDLVLVTPVFANLKLHWPDAVITVLVDEGYEGILKLNPHVSQILSIPRKGPRRASRWIELLKALRREKFTHVFDLDTNDRTALLTRFTGAAFRASYPSDKHRWRRNLAYNHVRVLAPGEQDRMPIVDYYAGLLPLAGVPIATRECLLLPTADDLKAASGCFSDTPKEKRVLLHPGSRSPYRIWPLDRFARLADRLQAELGVRVFLTGGPAESKLIEGIRAAAKTPLQVLPQPAHIGQFAAYAGEAHVFLCHDSGPMHVAAAAGARIVALFGSQNIVQWSPAGTGHQVIQAPQPCGDTCVAPGECIRGNGYKSYCVRRIDEETVFAAVSRALGR